MGDGDTAGTNLSNKPPYSNTSSSAVLAIDLPNILVRGIPGQMIKNSERLAVNEPFLAVFRMVRIKIQIK